VLERHLTVGFDLEPVGILEFVYHAIKFADSSVFATNDAICCAGGVTRRSHLS
jgi:hypothetical protein